MLRLCKIRIKNQVHTKFEGKKYRLCPSNINDQNSIRKNKTGHRTLCFVDLRFKKKHTKISKIGQKPKKVKSKL